LFKEHVVEDKQYSEKVVQILDTLDGMTLLEVKELVDGFKDKFGVEALSPMAGMMPMMPGAGVLRKKKRPAP